jgi:hypothetical protein
LFIGEVLNVSHGHLKAFEQGLHKAAVVVSVQPQQVAVGQVVVGW